MGDRSNEHMSTQTDDSHRGGLGAKKTGMFWVGSGGGASTGPEKKETRRKGLSGEMRKIKIGLRGTLGGKSRQKERRIRHKSESKSRIGGWRGGRKPTFVQRGKESIFNKPGRRLPWGWGVESESVGGGGKFAGPESSGFSFPRNKKNGKQNQSRLQKQGGSGGKKKEKVAVSPEKA